jgi:hypothetical protein
MIIKINQNKIKNKPKKCPKNKFKKIKKKAKHPTLLHPKKNLLSRNSLSLMSQNHNNLSMAHKIPHNPKRAVEREKVQKSRKSSQQHRSKDILLSNYNNSIKYVRNTHN